MKELEGLIKSAVQSLSGDPAKATLEHPGELLHGDYATSAALSLSKDLGKPPREIAELLKAEIEKNIPPYVSKIEIARAGFINFHLARDFFKNATANILSEGEKWGRNEHVKGYKVFVEYTDPNLFKPLHVGHLMANIIGESLSRLVEYSGAEITRINYPSDIGLTIAKGVWGLQKLNLNPDHIDELGKAYVAGNTAYEEDSSAKEQIVAINKALYANSDPVFSELRARGIKTSLGHVHEICEILGTSFNVEIFESQSAPVGEKIVRSHINDGIFEQSDGAIIYRGEKKGLHTRVFINSEGLPTYEAKDIGLVQLKRSPNAFDLSLSFTSL